MSAQVSELHVVTITAYEAACRSFAAPIPLPESDTVLTAVGYRGLLAFCRVGVDIRASRTHAAPWPR